MTRVVYFYTNKGYCGQIGQPVFFPNDEPLGMTVQQLVDNFANVKADHGISDTAEFKYIQVETK